MDLLPKSSKEFAAPEYWEQFFRRRGERAFEWYGGYLELCGLLHKYIKPRDKVFVVGCGNSELSEQLYDAGCQNLTNIDVSEVVIRQMNERNSNRRPNMTFQVMDATQTTFDDSCFQAVLDKGTLDAIMTDTDKGTLETADKLMSEIGRVLTCGGRFLCVSLAQAHVLEKLVRHFSQGGWMVRVHQVMQGSTSETGSQFPMPVFVFVMTKVRQISGFPTVLEMMPDEEGGKPVRWGSPEEFMEAVKERQRYALIRNRLNQNQSSQEVSLDLCDGDSRKSRYTFYIVDSPAVRLSHSNHFAIFIIPHGRETEWLFGSEQGRKQLAGSVGFNRLIIVALHRDQQYTDMKAIQSELSAKVLELAPPGLPDNQQIPFLSAGEDIGSRTIQHRGKSEFSGEYVVEDVRGDGNSSYRRLIFLSNQNVVQSEARLLPISTHIGQKKRKDKKKQQKPVKDLEQPTITRIDKSYLCCEHHKAMISGLALLPNPGLLPECQASVLVIGLGGGSLSLFIHDYFPGSRVEVVEIDPSVLDVASNWFNFCQDERMKVHLADGLVHINSLADNGEACYDVIMFDVDSKDPSVGMSCPPPAFVEKMFLQNVHNILNANGVFILNLVCRDTDLRLKVLNVLHEVFPLIYAQKIDEEVNEILFCRPNSERKFSSLELKESAKNLEKKLRKPGVQWDSTYSLAEMLKSVQIV
ncbi:eEF1A lysine and N-terminal methyltransferase [Xenopus laevis]|uniref:eEF1A lysine and N-terminal methyltransferase n=1 Tax=Xenopus laevis TaxID=8355 RepID=EFNMT_XENLA|nr:eEF1A lysine and N-terminal methyltransferase [Xenopus laevis]Q6NTR1.1 RecName: Full=eEF1A lysine and N-terminal methyltransferase; AltName: Full=Methyltransferase-like protein 13; Includes: RecName: Full=eEF1A lysine methyltransferase; Includes: RecName: Full=eEF1A N-terminal methyltransferase [Xenopus laevis]AAH68895.1 MGC83087 protein [Xenopus laevis]